MKKTLFVLVFSLFLIPSVSSASTLTTSQVNAIIAVLQSFNVDAKIVANVQNILAPKTSPNQNYCGGQFYPNCVGGTFACQANGQPTCGVPDLVPVGTVQTNTNIANALNDVQNALVALENTYGNCKPDSTLSDCVYSARQEADLRTIESTYLPVVNRSITPLCDNILAKSIETALASIRSLYTSFMNLTTESQAQRKDILTNNVNTTLQTLQTAAKCAQ